MHVNSRENQSTCFQRTISWKEFINFQETEEPPSNSERRCSFNFQSQEGIGPRGIIENKSGSYNESDHGLQGAAVTKINSESQKYVEPQFELWQASKALPKIADKEKVQAKVSDE